MHQTSKLHASRIGKGLGDTASMEIPLWTVDPLGSVQRSVFWRIGNTSDSYRHRNPKQPWICMRKRRGRRRGEKRTLKSCEKKSISTLSQRSPNLPSNLEKARLFPKRADPVKPCPTRQKIQPPYTLTQLLLSLQAVRKPADPFMKRCGNHILGNTWDRLPLCCRDLKS